MDGRCATCKHWMHDTLQGDQGYCRKANDESATSLMWARDEQNCRSDIWTSANFGCVMHEEKP